MDWMKSFEMMKDWKKLQLCREADGGISAATELYWVLTIIIIC
jgi:hypothetical protein